MAGEEAGPKLQAVDISKLNLGQLNALKQQLDQDISLFNDSLQQLKMAQTRFSESGESVDKLASEKTGVDILVPLTSSMYVPGQICDSSNVLLDVGTGYYLEKTLIGAKDYFQRRTKFVTEQMEKLQSLGMDKSRMREAVMEVMEEKIRGQMAAQQQAQAQKT